MRRVRGSLAALLVAGLAAVWLTSVPTTSGTLTGKITNATDTAISGITNGPCTSTARGTGSAYFVWPLDDGPAATTAWDSSRNSRPGAYVSTGRITYGAAGPCPRDNGRAVTLSGGTDGGYVTTASTTTAVAGPQTFTAAVWFRTGTAAGGKLIGFGNARTGASTDYDRHIYMTTGGNLVAGVFPGVFHFIQSPAAYNDNAWHHAVMTLAPLGNANPGLRLYVDGTLVATDLTALSAQVFNGFWRVGYDNLTYWPNIPGDNVWFAGSVAFASVYTTALTPTQISALNAAGR